MTAYAVETTACSAAYADGNTGVLRSSFFVLRTNERNARTATGAGTIDARSVRSATLTTSTEPERSPRTHRG